MKQTKQERKDNLNYPFERELTYNQKTLFNQITKNLLKQDFVINMTYPELFDVLERVKLSYEVDLLIRSGVVKLIKKKSRK